MNDPQYRFTGAFGGEDQDNDGVPDICDTCPTRKNPYDSNRVQADTDGDGIGDACDWCETDQTRRDDVVCCDTDASCAGAGGKCILFPATLSKYYDRDPADPLTTIYNRCSSDFVHFNGRCATGADDDGDRVGDQCDNCPGARNSDQLDTDQDGAGDECDLCAGVHEFPPSPQAEDRAVESCNYRVNPPAADAACRQASNDARSRCAPLPGTTGKGVCTFQEDSDGDGIGDLCDGCPADADAPKMTLETNCNLVTELATNAPYPFRTDQCDPSPCASFVFGWDPVLEDPAHPEWAAWNVGGYAPRTLPERHQDAYGYTTARGGVNLPMTRPKANVGFRYCECELGDAVDCARSFFCRVDQPVADYGSAQSVWRQLPTTGLPPTLPPMPPAFPVYEPGAEIPQRPLFTANPKFVDTTAMGTPALPLADPGTLQYLVGWNLSTLPLRELPTAFGEAGLGLPVVMWSHIPHVDGIQVANEPTYRETSSSHLAGILGRPAVEYPRPDDFPVNSCGPLCDFRDCEVCKYLAFDASIYINPVDDRILAGGNQRFGDLGLAFSSGLRASLLGAVDGAWLNAEEPVEYRRMDTVQVAVLYEGQFRALVQRRDGQFVDARESSGGGPVGGDGQLGGGGQVGGDGAPSGGTLPAVANGAALLLSANERAVFSLGGYLGETPALVRRYSTLPAGAIAGWEELDFNVVFGGVLAATYSAPERTLYALDRGASSARLLALDLRTGGVAELGSWPLGSNLTEFYLASTWDSALLLGTSGGGQYSVVKFRAVPGAAIGEWTVSGAGSLAEKPALKRTGLDLIVLNPNGVRVSTRVAPPTTGSVGSLASCLD